MTTEHPAVDPEIEAAWRDVLNNGHPGRWSFLPSGPRCTMCDQPLHGLGGKLLNAFTGIHAARMTPNMCNY